MRHCVVKTKLPFSSHEDRFSKLNSKSFPMSNPFRRALSSVTYISSRSLSSFDSGWVASSEFKRSNPLATPSNEPSASPTK